MVPVFRVSVHSKLHCPLATPGLVPAGRRSWVPSRTDQALVRYPTVGAPVKPCVDLECARSGHGVSLAMVARNPRSQRQVGRTSTWRSRSPASRSVTGSGDISPMGCVTVTTSASFPNITANIHLFFCLSVFWCTGKYLIPGRNTEGTCRSVRRGRTSCAAHVIGHPINKWR